MRVAKLRSFFYTKVNFNDGFQFIFFCIPSTLNIIYLHFFFAFAFLSGEILPNFQNIRGRDSFSVCVKMHGGNGDCAWQHTQLFRQSMTDNEYPFELNITFV